MTYTIQTNDGKLIPLYFGTWAISRFCELNGNLSFTGMQEVMSDLSYKHIISLVLCGAEHYAKKHNQKFDYTDVNAADWIDDLGGLTSPKAMELLTFIGKAVNPSYQGVEVTKDGGKKKTSRGSTSA